MTFTAWSADGKRKVRVDRVMPGSIVGWDEDVESITDAKKTQIHTLRQRGLKQDDIANIVGCCRATVSSVLRQETVRASLRAGGVDATPEASAPSPIHDDYPRPTRGRASVRPHSFSEAS